MKEVEIIHLSADRYQILCGYRSGLFGYRSTSRLEFDQESNSYATNPILKP